MTETLERKIHDSKGIIRASEELVPSSIYHYSQIVSAFIDQHRAHPTDFLGDASFLVADGAVYAAEQNKAILYLTTISENPIINNLNEAIKQLRVQGNYILSSDELGKVRKAKTLLKIILEELNLKEESDGFGYFEIEAGKAYKSNPAERRFGQRILGSCEDLDDNMDWLHDAGIKKVRISVLMPWYVKDVISNIGNGAAIARACSLEKIGQEYRFSAIMKSVEYEGFLVRGILRNGQH